MSLLITPRRPTEAERARQVKAFIMDHASRAHLAAGANPNTQLLTLVESRYPGSVDHYGATALLALARTGGACYWCRTWPAAGADPRQLPDPYNAGTWTILGKPCTHCYGELRRRYWRMTPAGRQAALDRYRRSRQQQP